MVYYKSRRECMATKKSASKTTKKATSEVVVNEKVAKKSVKAVKKSGSILIVVLCLFVGVLLGAGAWWIVCRDDCFDLVGVEEIMLTLDEAYVDEGVYVVAFGKDQSDNITIETNLQIDENGNYTSSEVGTFYITYKSECFKYGKLFKIQKVRLVTFVEVSEGGE